MAEQFQVITKVFNSGSRRDELTTKSHGWRVGQSVKFPAFGEPFKVLRLRVLEKKEVRLAALAAPESRTPLEWQIVNRLSEMLTAEELAALLPKRIEANKKNGRQKILAAVEVDVEGETARIVNAYGANLIEASIRDVLSAVKSRRPARV